MSDSAPQRVVSLISSATEILCALGCRDRLVGRSHECDYPADVHDLPVCTEPKFPTEGSSREIDQSVRTLVEQGLSVYRVDAEKLNELQPDLIITQSQCEVCAVSLKDVENAVCEMVNTKPAVLSLEPHQLSDLWDDIHAVASALHVGSAGGSLCQHLQGRIDRVSYKAKNAGTRPRVACIEWIDPLMAAGNWTPELIDRAGGDNLFGEAGKHTPELSWEAVRNADPDVIVVTPCGWGIDKTREEMGGLANRDGWAELSAVKNKRVYIGDGNRYFNRPGPRLAETTEILGEMLHPELFDFHHRGDGWQAWEN